MSATATELHVVVPGCVPDREALPVTVQVGPVASAASYVAVRAAGGPALTLEAGQAVSFRGPAPCIRFAPAADERRYLLAVQNAGHRFPAVMPFRLRGLLADPPPAAAAHPSPASAAAVDPAARFERELRSREREIPLGALVRTTSPEPGILAAATAPSIGDRRRFSVYSRGGDFTEVEAEVRHVSDRAILYMDLESPGGGFRDAELEEFGRLFDDPIYGTVTGAFGEPSDIDGNGRVIVLFTPVVNGFSPLADPGTPVAGFFFAHDLTTRPGSNRAEIFYSAVPDPDARFGWPRLADELLHQVPQVLAHELQHMVHYNQRWFERGVGLDSLWVAEGLAHMAEQLVADELLVRGDTLRARTFQAPNRQRARQYLQAPPATSLVATLPPGSLAERGAQWLFFLYLAGHHGGEAFLRTVTQTELAGAENVAAAAGRAWDALVGDWAVALGVAGEPGLEHDVVDRRHTYADFDLRGQLAVPGGGFPLRPRAFAFEDMLIEGVLPASSAQHLVLTAEGGSPGPLHVSFGGRWGGEFADDAAPRLTILRVW